MTTTFRKGDPTAGALLAWWRGLEHDRADRAQLRRCATLLQVMQTEAFHAARRRFIAAGMCDADSRKPRLASIVGLAAHLTSMTDEAFPKTCSLGDKPAVSPLRFRQMLEADDDDELFTRIRRVIPLVDGRANVVALAANIWYWGDAVRKSWVYEYAWPAKERA
jgi:CRISPR system Cascade subunit CasB